MKTYTCFSCEKDFKNSRSLASHNFKFHSSAKSTANTHVHNFKDGDSSLSKVSSSAEFTKSGGATIRETLIELKALIGSLQRRVKLQEDKVDDLDNHVLQIYSTGIKGIENKLEKVTNAVRTYNEQFFEDMVYDTLLMRTLLRGRGIKLVENRISELKNAAIAISQAFDFNRKQTLLLEKISNASFTEAKEILEDNVNFIKDIFSSLPPEHELEAIIRGPDGTATNKNSETEIKSKDSSVVPSAEESDTDDSSPDSQEQLSDDFSKNSSEDE